MNQGLIERLPPVPGGDMVVGSITADGRTRVRGGGVGDRIPTTGSVWLGPFGDRGSPTAVFRDGMVWLGPVDRGSPDGRYRDGFVWLGPVERGADDATYRRTNPWQPGGGIWHPGFLAWTGALPNATLKNGRIWKGPLGETIGALPDGTFRGDDYGAAAAAVVLDLVTPSIRHPAPSTLPD